MQELTLAEQADRADVPDGVATRYPPDYPDGGDSRNGIETPLNPQTFLLHAMV